MRNEAACAQRATVLWRRNERHFGIVLLAHIAQAHQQRNLDSQCFNLGFQLCIGIHLGNRLITGSA